MKCQILFSGKNKKNIINLSSAENAQRVVKVKEIKLPDSTPAAANMVGCQSTACMILKNKNLLLLLLQSNLDSSNTDGSFAIANSNSFLSPYEILPIA